MTVTNALIQRQTAREPYALAFEIAGLPKVPNELLGAHWRVRAGHAKRWERAVWREVWPLKPAAPLTKARLTLTRCSARTPDFDNLALSFKPVVDALVKCGVLIDDTPAVIGQPTYAHEKVRPGKGKIKIQVEGRI